MEQSQEDSGRPVTLPGTLYWYKEYQVLLGSRFPKCCMCIAHPGSFVLLFQLGYRQLFWKPRPPPHNFSYTKAGHSKEPAWPDIKLWLSKKNQVFGNATHFHVIGNQIQHCQLWSSSSYMPSDWWLCLHLPCSKKSWEGFNDQFGSCNSLC